MNQIWLKCIIFDPESGTVIDRWGDHPLPETLQIKHLRSYLEQRFGEPLETDVGDAKGVTFWAPPDSGPKGAVLLAIPLMRDPDSGEIFSIFKRLAQLAPLAAGLGTQGGFDLLQFDLKEPWVGPMFHSTHLCQETNDAAARAMRAWLIAAGLAAEIESIRAEQAKAPPLPGLARLRERVDNAAKGAAAAADPAWNLCEQVKRCAAAVGATDTPDGKAAKELHETEGQLLAAYEKASEFAKEAECATRSLAQLGFGISALLGGSDRIERLDRACVAVLHPPDGHGIAVPLLGDGVILNATSRDELVVEIAGIVCRLLIDRGAKVKFEAPGPGGGSFEFEVQPGDLLVAFSRAASPTPIVVEKPKKAGKPRRREKAYFHDLYQWESPVRVHEPAKLAVDKLFDTFGLERPSQLVVTVEPATPATSSPQEHSPQDQKGWVM